MIALLSFALAASAEFSIPKADEYVHLRLHALTSIDISPRKGALPPAQPTRDGEVAVDFYFKPGSIDATPIVRARYEVQLVGGGVERIDTGYRIARYSTTEEYESSRRKALGVVGRYLSVKGYDDPPFEEVGLAATMTGTSAQAGFDIVKAITHIFETKRFEVNEFTVVLPALMYSGHVFDAAQTEFRLVHVFEQRKQRAFELRRQYKAIAYREKLGPDELRTLEQLVAMACGPELAPGRRAN